MSEVRPERQPEGLLRHTVWVRELAKALVEPHRVDDVVQDTWVAALEQPAGPAGRIRHPRAWLSGVLRNVVRQGRRGEARRISREQRVEAPGPETSAAEIVERADQHQRVVKAVLELEEPLRSTLLMRYFDELSAEEIARRSGLPGTTVRSRLQTGLERLRERFTREAGGDTRAWCLGLIAFAAPRPGAASIPPVAASPAPLAATPSSVLTSLTSSGVLAMTLKTLTATLVVLGIGFGTGQALRREGEAPGTPVVAATHGEAEPTEATQAGSHAPRTIPQQEGRKPVKTARPAAGNALTVSGRVVDAEGRPVPGVTVFVGGRPSPFAEVTAGLQLLQAERKPAQGVPGETYREVKIRGALQEWIQAGPERLADLGAVLGRTTTSDAKGLFALKLPAPGKVYVSGMRTIGIEPLENGAWHAIPRTSDRMIELTVQRIPTADVSIRVTDLSTQEPLEEWVGHVLRGERGVSEWRTAKAVHQLELEVPRGESNRFRVQIHEPVWARAAQDFTVIPGRSTEVEVLVQSGAGFSGQVVDATGAPVEGAFVFWGVPSDMRGHAFGHHEPERITGGVRSGADGHFTLPGMARHVTAWHAEHSPAEAGVREAQRLVLPARGAIQGVLFDESGSPLVDETVTLDRSRRTQTDASGSFAFGKVEAGVHGVQQGPAGFLGVRVEPGETVEIRPAALLASPVWEITAGGAPLPAQRMGGVVVGLGQVYSLSEWFLEDSRVKSGKLRPGGYLVMGRGGLMTLLEAPGRAPLELGSSLTLEFPRERDFPPTYVLPARVATNQTANDWGLRLFGEREARELTWNYLSAGSYAIVVKGRGVIQRLEMAAGEAKRLPFEEWASRPDAGR